MSNGETRGFIYWQDEPTPAKLTVIKVGASKTANVPDGVYSAFEVTSRTVTTNGVASVVSLPAPTAGGSGNQIKFPREGTYLLWPRNKQDSGQLDHDDSDPIRVTGDFGVGASPVAITAPEGTWTTLEVTKVGTARNVKTLSPCAVADPCPDPPEPPPPGPVDTEATISTADAALTAK